MKIQCMKLWRSIRQRTICSTCGHQPYKGSWGLRRQLEGVFREGRFDVIHVHGGLAPTFGTLTPFAARGAGIPVVATFHSWFPRSAACRILQRPLQRLLDLHAANIAVSQPVVEANSRYFTAEWEVIPNGVDVEYFHPDGRGSATSSSRGPRLLYLHRLEPRNHLGTLLRAMPRILERYPDAKLMVAGDGPWRRYYERIARRLRPSVRFLGRIEDRPDHYRAADLYLCPTTRAAFGITLLEAMACGTPLVLADNPGFRAVAGDGAEAVILPHDDHGAWAKTVIALAGDPARRRKMGESGMVKAAGYAWPRVAERILGVYHRAIRNGSAA